MIFKRKIFGLKNVHGTFIYDVIQDIYASDTKLSCFIIGQTSLTCFDGIKSIFLKSGSTL